MKEERDYRDFLKDIVRYAEIGARIISDADFNAFCSNEEKILAAIQVLEVIGEASKCLPESLKRRYPEVPWRDIAGTRDKLIHAYYLIDLETVWRTIKDDIPPLKRSVIRILDDMEKKADERPNAQK